MIKEGCWDCVLKHLGDAVTNYEESVLGYPEWLADVVGNLNQASIEAFTFHPELAECIRQHRKLFIVGLISGATYRVPTRELFMYTLSCAQLHSQQAELPKIPDELQPRETAEKPEEEVNF